MMDESAYRRFIEALRVPERLTELASDDAFREPIFVDILVAVSTGPVWRQVWKQIEATPFELIESWHRRVDLLALSIPVTFFAEETKRSCITQCADGSIQERFCSETADDIVNCTDVVRQQCGPGGTAAQLTFIGPPASTGGEPRVRLPEVRHGVFNWIREMLK